MVTRSQEPSDEAQVPTNVELRAILAVLAASREAQIGENDLRTELLLSDAGIANKDIATLLGKNPDAVRMLVSRSRKSNKTAPTSKKGK